ncbi:MAG TPA: DUF1622 domain-containing protein [Bacteroidales bacterium]|nr:DUF1622 domain-containing protein [Bacteroidales bacterium]HNS46180.1 DUF1622 domain-containing protein [Bacteroidales bacterium]
METLELFLEKAVSVISLALEYSAVLCIAIGFVNAFILLLKSKQLNFSPSFNRLKFKFGGWLALALEFQLASDIIKTTVAPTYENLIQLGAIAVIRTFLNYFLNKELKELPEQIMKNVGNKKTESISETMNQ